MLENNQNYKKLDRYWELHGKKRRISDRLALKASYNFNNENNWKNNFILNMIRGSRMFVYSILAMICEMLENYCRKKRLSRLLNLQKDEVAVDINDLLKHKEKIRCYGDEFTYNAATDKGCLKNIEVIFGDAHLEALDDTACLGNLRKVTGKVYYKGMKVQGINALV